MPRTESLRVEFRRDIEGLRAVAVIPVVIFHVAQSYMPGGFVGVDIFFVISGYLISSHILSQRDQGLFSILAFYERRVRRIAPAYLVLLAVVTPLIVAKFLPSEIRGYGWSLIAAIGSYTNVYFWSTTNYFAVPAEEAPLLHTWSLSTEEQFYFVFPLLIVSIRNRSPRTQQLLVGAVLAVSLLYSSVTAYAAPTSSFYLILSRAWELLLGSMLALTRRARSEPPSRVAELVALVGILMICGAMAYYSQDTVFPGLAAIPPCLGAAVLIRVGETRATVVSRALAVRPLRFFGAISYSLYLWHWPVLVLQRTTGFMMFGEPRAIARGAVVVVSVALAALSWSIVERFTRNRRLVKTRPLVVCVVAGALVLLLVAATLIVSEGLSYRFAPEVRTVASYLDYDQTEQFRVSRCFLTREDSFATFDRNLCLPHEAQRPTYLIVGDSHAAALAFGLRKAFDNANVLQVTGVGCPPILTLQRSASAACPDLLKLAFDELPARRKIDTVWLAARWNLGRMGPAPGWNPGWLSQLGETAERLRSKGLNVVIIGPMPEYTRELPRLIAEGMLHRDPDEAERAFSRETIALDKVMADFARSRGLPYVSIAEALCSSGSCLREVGVDTPLLFDTDHLTAAGSIYLAERIRPQLAQPR